MERERSEVADSQMEEESPIKTVNSKADHQKEERQGAENRPKMSTEPAIEKDTEMKEAGKATEGLAESKHAVKELSEKEIEEIVKGFGLQEEEVEDEDKEMGQEQEEGRSDLFNAAHDSRNALGLIKSILKNNEVVEEFRALPNKKKWWKPAKDANLAKR